MARASDRAVALLADGRLIFVGSTFFLYFLNHEKHYRRFKAQLLWDPGAKVRLGRHDGSMYDIINFGQMIEQLRDNKQFNLNYMGLLLQTIFINVGDELSRNSYFDRSPELEFFRHIRNALGHGNRFHFVRGEPSRPAVFDGRDLTAALNGKEVFFEYMNTGDALALMEQVSDHLKNLP